MGKSPVTSRRSVDRDALICVDAPHVSSGSVFGDGRRRASGAVYHSRSSIRGSRVVKARAIGNTRKLVVRDARGTEEN